MFHYFDHDAQEWRAVENPTIEDITAAVEGAVNAGPPCQSCDAVVEFCPPVGDGPPVWVVHHGDDCDAA